MPLPSKHTLPAQTKNSSEKQSKVRTKAVKSTGRGRAVYKNKTIFHFQIFINYSLLNKSHWFGFQHTVVSESRLKKSERQAKYFLKHDQPRCKWSVAWVRGLKQCWKSGDEKYHSCPDHYKSPSPWIQAQDTGTVQNQIFRKLERRGEKQIRLLDLFSSIQQQHSEKVEIPFFFYHADTSDAFIKYTYTPY